MENQKEPTLENINQSVAENSVIEDGNDIEITEQDKQRLSEKALRELEEEQANLRFLSSKTKEEIDNSIAKKEKGDEKIDSWKIPVSEYKPKTRGGIKNWTLGAFAALMSLGSAKGAEVKTPEDSVGKKPLTEKATNLSDSLEAKSNTRKAYEQNIINEKLGHITLEGSIFIPQKDTTKEVFVYYFSDDGKSKNALVEILDVMKQKGLTPAYGKLLEQVYEQNKDNPEFNKKAKWIMAPTPEGDADDTQQDKKFLVTKNGRSEFVLPEHAVFPTKSPTGLGRFEVDQGFDAKEYGLMFYKEAEKDKIANFESGLVKQ